MFSSSVVARGRQEPYFIRISSLCLQVQAIGEARIWQGHLAPLGQTKVLKSTQALCFRCRVLLYPHVWIYEVKAISDHRG